MRSRLVVVPLLLFHDLSDCFNSGLVFASKHLQLLAKVPEDNTLNRLRRSRRRD